jgi:hypothetical protein
VRVPTYAWIAGGAVLVSGVALIVEALTSKPRRVALIGDSLAVGLGPELAQLAAKSGVPFKSEGRVGSTVAQWLATPSWGSWVPGYAPSTTLICLGTNDYLNPAPSLAQYCQLAAKFPGAWWIQPPDEPKAPMPKVHAVISQIGIPVIPEATGLSYGADGIHPTSYTSWASFIWKILGATPGVLT